MNKIFLIPITLLTFNLFCAEQPKIIITKKVTRQSSLYKETILYTKKVKRKITEAIKLVHCAGFIAYEGSIIDPCKVYSRHCYGNYAEKIYNELESEYKSLPVEQYLGVDVKDLSSSVTARFKYLE